MSYAFVKFTRDKTRGEAMIKIGEKFNYISAEAIRKIEYAQEIVVWYDKLNKALKIVHAFNNEIGTIRLIYNKHQKTATFNCLRLKMVMPIGKYYWNGTYQCYKMI